MSDILDAAQKQINDAANKLSPPAAASGAAPPADPAPSTPPPPPDPTPAPPPTAPPMPAPEPAKPPEPAAEPTPEESAFVDKLIHETTSASAAAAPEPPAPLPPTPEPVAPLPEEKLTPPPAAPKKKGTGRAAMIAAILLLLITLPLGVFFVSQQQKQLTDTRSRASIAEPCLDCNLDTHKCERTGVTGCSSTLNTCSRLGTSCGGSAPTATPRPAATATPTPLAPGGETCEKQFGGVCRSPGLDVQNACQKFGAQDCPADEVCIKRCPTPTPIPESCEPGEFRHDSRSRDVVEEDCRDRCRTDSCVGTIQQRGTYPNYFWCYKCQGVGGGGPTSAPTPTPTSPPGGGPPGRGEPTPTTPPQVLQCRAISIYKNGEKVTDYSTLKSGDTVVLAVKGDNATKGRFRVNGAPPTFEESTGTNANGEFTFPFPIPSDVPNNSITIEAEVFQNGVWK